MTSCPSVDVAYVCTVRYRGVPCGSKENTNQWNSIKNHNMDKIVFVEYIYRNRLETSQHSILQDIESPMNMTILHK